MLSASFIDSNKNFNSILKINFYFVHSEKRLWVHQQRLHRRKDAVQQPLPPSLLSGFVSFNQIQFNINNLLRYQKWLDYHGRLYWTQSFEIGYLEPNAAQQPLTPSLLLGFAIASLDQMQFDNLLRFQNWLDYHRRSHRSLRFAHNFLTKKYSSATLTVLVPLDCHQVLQLIIASMQNSPKLALVA